MLRPRPCHYSSLTCHPADEIRSLTRIIHDNVITLYIYSSILYYIVLLTRARCVYTKRKLRTAKRRNDNNNNSIDMRVRNTATELVRGKRLMHAPSVRAVFFYSSEFPLPDR
jgi:hypothetical protein